MNDKDLIQRLVDEFNDRAKAEGRYLDKDFWEIPRRPGSILDVPETPESRERVAWLLKRVAELKAEAEKESVHVQDIQQETGDAAQSPLLAKKAV